MSISREQRKSKPRTAKQKRERDYKAEYEWQGTEEQKKRRAGRNAARAKMEKAGKVRKGDGKDVSHDNHDTTDNRSSNLTVKKRSNNRSKHGRVY
jgi:hypothetical protein